MRNYAEAREDKNVYLRVSEEPEQVLVEDGVPSACGVKEGCI